MKCRERGVEKSGKREVGGFQACRTVIEEASPAGEKQVVCQRDAMATSHWKDFVFAVAIKSGPLD